MREVFDLRCRIIDDPVAGTPMVVPIGRHLDVALESEGKGHE